MLENKQTGADIPPVFHIWQMGTDPNLLYVEIPWAGLDPWELKEYLPPFMRYSSSVDTVYDISMSLWLKKRRLTEWWSRAWPYPEYRNYHQKDYAMQLLQKGASVHKTGHFFVLGYEDFVPEALMPHVKSMKSLTFLVRREYEALEDFMEELNEEYGLAAALRVVPDDGLLCPECAFPATILDLSGERKVEMSHVKEGGIWLDMDSSEEKRRRAEACGGQMAYFSVKKEWERQGKQRNSQNVSEKLVLRS